MEVLGQLSLAQLKILNLRTWIIHNLESNGISASGVEMLTRGKWQSLENLDLSKNRIENEGVGYLSRS